MKSIWTKNHALEIFSVALEYIELYKSREGEAPREISAINGLAEYLYTYAANKPIVDARLAAKTEQ